MMCEKCGSVATKMFVPPLRLIEIMGKTQPAEREYKYFCTNCTRLLQKLQKLIQGRYV